MPVDPNTSAAFRAELDRLEPDEAEAVLAAVGAAIVACDSATTARLMPFIEGQRALCFATAAFHLRDAHGPDHPQARMFAVLAREHRSAHEAARLIASAMPEDEFVDPAKLWAAGDE